MRSTYYVTCPLCGSNLDPGEHCTCNERGQRYDGSRKSKGNTETKHGSTKSEGSRKEADPGEAEEGLSRLVG